jgi:DNA invertase Pin-like site-specific DNA recombinase
MSKPIAHLYIRVSDLSGRNGESLYTVDDQEEKGRELAVSRGYDVGKVVRDTNVSGGKSAAERDLGPLIQSCEQGEASAIIVWHFDRSPVSIPTRPCPRLDVANNFDSGSEMGVMAASMLSIGAHAYRERMRKGWAMTQERSLKRGAYPGKTPWGFLRNEDGTLRVNDSLVEVIRELFQRRAEGAGINGLCDWLVSKGVRSPSGGRGWVHSALSPILASRRYLGEFRFGEQTFNDPDLAIVTEQEWQAAQLPKGKIVPKTGKTSDRSLVRGIARCAGCGHTLKILHSNHDRLNYYCKNKSAKGECPARVYGDVPSGDLLASWPDLTVAQKRRLLAAFVDTANVTKGTGPIADRVQFVRDGVVIADAKEKEGSFRSDRRTTAGH